MVVVTGRHCKWFLAALPAASCDLDVRLHLAVHAEKTHSPHGKSLSVVVLCRPSSGREENAFRCVIVFAPCSFFVVDVVFSLCHIDEGAVKQHDILQTINRAVVRSSVVSYIVLVLAIACPEVCAKCVCVRNLESSVKFHSRVRRWSVDHFGTMVV